MILRIVITGGAGFLGSHLCDRLFNEGHVVFCIDNFYTGKTENIQHLLDQQTNDKGGVFYLIEHDVCNLFLYNSLFGKIDQIYSFASPASPEKYQIEPIFTAKTNFLGSLHCLELAEKYNASILLASTSEVYGEPLEHPQVEDYRGNVNTVGLRSCYDESKRISETLFSDYRRQKGLNTKIVRIHNTYGPRLNSGDGRVVSNFIVAALQNKPITIYGSGEQTRSFCFCDDTIDGVIKAMNANSAFLGPINIGTPSEITINQLASVVLNLTNSNSEIIYYPLPSDDPSRRLPCIYLAKSVLNWEPKVSLEEGLLKTIEYFKHLL